MNACTKTNASEKQTELIEDEIEMINARLAVIARHIKEQPNIAAASSFRTEKPEAAI